MAKKPAEPAEVVKTRKLRELREADEAKRKADGVWGALAVGEIAHPASKSVFVLRCRGRDAPDLAKEIKTRSPLVAAEDHKALIEWLGQRPVTEFQSRLVAWNLSDSEAKRIRQARIDENRTKGLRVVNPAASAAVVSAPAS